MNIQDFIGPSKLLNEGVTNWSSPSNIALVKYWGKHGEQLPKNSSISFTLSKCISSTELIFKENKTKSKKLEYDFYFEGNFKPEFKFKIDIFFNRIKKYIPWINSCYLTINSKNSFPHSSGIASSASAMSSIAICLMDIERLMNPNMNNAFFLKKASFLSRLGSGSASRSIVGPVSIWGKNDFISECNDYYALEFKEGLHEVFKSYCDTILIIDKEKKIISSTKGHEMMINHPFSKHRFIEANKNVNLLIEVMKSGNLDAFISIVESEALSLHAMMMTSQPYFILLNPTTLEVINRVLKFRKESKTPICFTLDAGANIHLLYPKEYSSKALNFIKKELLIFCHEEKLIMDHVGDGPKKI
jgi:diphosphomevalonate decarboxylase